MAKRKGAGAGAKTSSEVAKQQASAKHVLESCDGMPLSKPAEKIKPPSARMANKDAYQEAVNAWKAQVKLTDFACKYKNLLLQAWSTVEGIMMKYIDEGGSSAEQFFSAQYKKFWRLPACAYGAWVVKHFDDKLTAQIIQALVVTHGTDDIQRQLVYSLTGIAALDAVPEALLEKMVWSQAMTIRSEPYSVQSDALLRFLKSTGGKTKIDWLKVGPYGLEFNPRTKKATFIVHRRTGCRKQLDDDVVIKVGAAITHGFSEMLAEVKNSRGGRFVLCELFEEDEGPNSDTNLPKSLANAAKLAKKDIQSKKKRLRQDRRCCSCKGDI